MNVMLKTLTIAIATFSLSMSFQSEAKVPAEKQELVEKLKKKRGGQVLGPRVGKKIGKAYELYSEDNINEALEMLLELEPRGDFDKAYVNRFIGNMYASIEGKADTAIARLKEAKEADVLPFNDHAGTIKLLADLSLQQRRYAEALKYYQEFIDFSHDEDPNVYLRMANAHYELKDFAKVIEPAQTAIDLFETPNQNPYILIMASYYERKMYKEATKAVENLVKVFPENGKWWSQLGSFYMMTEDYQRGLSTMEVAYKQGFLETENQIKQLAQLYATNGIPYQAAVVQEKHLKEGLIKESKQAYSVLASTYQNAKEFAKAAEYYGKAAELSQDGELYRKQGNMFLALEKHDSAVKAYEKAVKLGVKRKGAVYMSIAEAHYYERNWKAANNAIDEAIKDKNSAKSAKSWKAYIREAASRNGTTL